MRIIAIHDLSGNIRSIASFDGPPGISLTLQPGPGELVAEIEGHGLGDDKAHDEKALRSLARNYVVADPMPVRSVVRKRKKSRGRARAI